ncbi:unnamed protein product [Knipowitschia caucasica]
MEAAIQSLVKVYLKSSKGKENLRKKDFQNLVSSQLSNILSGTDSKEAINNMAAGLDENQDGKLGFPEYMKLIGYLAVSLSEQQGQAKEEPNQNATGQVAQSSPDKEEKAEATEANAEVKAEPKAEPEAKPEAEPKAEAKPKAELSEVVAAAAAEVPATALSVEPSKVEVGAEVKAEGEGPKGETTETVVTTTTVTTVVNEVVNGVSEFSEVTKVKEVKEVDGEVEVKEEVKVETVKAEEAPAAEEKKEETAS